MSNQISVAHMFRDSIILQTTCSSNQYILSKAIVLQHIHDLLCACRPFKLFLCLDCRLIPFTGIKYRMCFFSISFNSNRCQISDWSYITILKLNCSMLFLYFVSLFCSVPLLQSLLVWLLIATNIWCLATVESEYADFIASGFELSSHQPLITNWTSWKWRGGHANMFVGEIYLNPTFLSLNPSGSLSTLVPNLSTINMPPTDKLFPQTRTVMASLYQYALILMILLMRIHWVSNIHLISVGWSLSILLFDYSLLCHSLALSVSSHYHCCQIKIGWHWRPCSAGRFRTCSYGVSCFKVDNPAWPWTWLRTIYVEGIVEM